MDPYNVIGIPAIFIEKARAHPMLKDAFKNTSVSKYAAMMGQILTNMVNNNMTKGELMHLHEIHSKHHITPDHINAWIEVMKDAAKESGVEEKFLETYVHQLHSLCKIIVKKKPPDIKEIVDGIIVELNKDDFDKARVIADLKTLIASSRD